MAEKHTKLVRLRLEKQVEVGDALASKFGAQSLSEAELRRFGLRFSGGWKMTLNADGRAFPVVVLAGQNFPFEPPEVLLEDVSYFLKFPHVDRFGKLCLLDAEATVSPEQAADVALYLIADAQQLLKESSSGTNREDFIREFNSYWSRQSRAHKRAFWSDLRPQGPSREVFIWSDQRFVFFAESSDDCERWVKHYYGGSLPKDFVANPSALAWFREPLFPEDYPTTAASVLRLIERRAPEAKAIVAQAIPRQTGTLPLLLGFAYGGEAIFAGVEVQEPVIASPQPRGGVINARNQGYRAGTVPVDVLVPRYFGTTPVEAAEVSRVDDEWLLSRGGTGMIKEISEKSVVLVGCGSIGADVAFLLAKSGVRRLVLVDNDTLSWSNVGRHLLGGDHVRQSKTSALANFLQHQMPWLEVVASSQKCNELLNDRPRLLKESHLIISTTGNWSCDFALNCAKRSLGRFPPVIFGWTEAYGLAGHALAVLDSGGCFACGTTGVGVFDRRVTDWPEGENTLRRPAGCSDVFQPYGMVDVAPTKSMIAELAIDVLCGRVVSSELRTWVSNLGRLAELKGIVRSVWLKRGSAAELSKRFFHEDWIVNSKCSLCSA